MDTFARLGFEALTITINFLFGELWSSNRCVWMRRGTSGREFILIAGFNQPSETWEWFITNVIRKDDTVMVIERRRTENRSWWRGFIGWTPLWFQKLEVKLIYQKLLDYKIVRPGATIVGHSVGAIMARHLAVTFLDVGDLIQITPVPDKWGSLWNWSFWKNGGLTSVPLAIFGTIFPFIGLRISESAARGLYTGKELEDFNLYRYHRRQLVADSPLVFYALVFWYCGGLIDQARAGGWKGHEVTFTAANDAIFPNNGTSKEDELSASLRTGTPHCYWFVNTRIGVENAERFKAKVYPRSGFVLRLDAEPCVEDSDW